MNGRYLYFALLFAPHKENRFKYHVKEVGPGNVEMESELGLDGFGCS